MGPGRISQWLGRGIRDCLSPSMLVSDTNMGGGKQLEGTDTSISTFQRPSELVFLLLHLQLVLVPQKQPFFPFPAFLECRSHRGEGEYRGEGEFGIGGGGGGRARGGHCSRLFIPENLFWRRENAFWKVGQILIPVPHFFKFMVKCVCGKSEHPGM